VRYWLGWLPGGEHAVSHQSQIMCADGYAMTGPRAARAHRPADVELVNDEFGFETSRCGICHRPVHQVGRVWRHDLAQERHERRRAGILRSNDRLGRWLVVINPLTGFVAAVILAGFGYRDLGFVAFGGSIVFAIAVFAFAENRVI
jgi:hypothetical protein